jgi:L-ascorbate metabolism protein UlaG (beta-lactamase superfamily)
MSLNLKRPFSITLGALFVSLFLVWLLFLNSGQENAASQKPLQLPIGNSLTITYIANEGVLISAGDKQVLIDGLHREYKPDYVFPPRDLLNALEQARDPYDKIDLVLVSHLHLDHFHPESVGLHLKNNKSAQLASSEQIVNGVKEKYAGFAEIESKVKQVTPSWKSQTTVELDGIKIKVLGLRHSGSNFVWLQNLGHVIEIGGKRLLHIGDADMTAENFSSFRLQEENIDIAFIPYWFLFSSRGRSLVMEQFRPKQIIAVHVSPEEAESATRQITKAIPGTIVFTKVLESRRF